MQLSHTNFTFAVLSHNTRLVDGGNFCLWHSLWIVARQMKHSYRTPFDVIFLHFMHFAALFRQIISPTSDWILFLLIWSMFQTVIEEMLISFSAVKFTSTWLATCLHLRLMKRWFDIERTRRHEQVRSTKGALWCCENVSVFVGVAEKRTKSIVVGVIVIVASFPTFYIFDDMSRLYALRSSVDIVLNFCAIFRERRRIIKDAITQSLKLNVDSGKNYENKNIETMTLYCNEILVVGLVSLVIQTKAK